MKKQSILAIFILTTLFVQAQSALSSLGFREREAVETMPSEIENQRFFNEDSTFREGELRTRKKLYTTELVYRFNQVERAIEVKMEGGKTMYLNTKDILYCKVFYEGDTAVFMPVVVPNIKKQMLVQVVYKTPTLQLYRDIHKTFTRRIISYTYKEVEDIIAHDYQYYIRKNNDDPLVKVKITPSSLSEIMPKKHNKIVSLFKGKEDLTVSQLMQIMGKLDSPATVQ
jgi:hypothetical protein